MKKQILAASVALALATGATSALAGGIQIDTSGTGTVGGSSFVVDPGNSFGNALAQGAFAAVAAPNAGTFFIQNAIDISGQTGIAGSRLTFVMDIPVLNSTTIDIGGVQGVTDFNALGGSGTGTFSLYYEDPTTGGSAANKGAGTGFTDDIFLASGTVALTAGASWLYTSVIPGTVDLDPSGTGPGATQTIQGAGSTSFDIDFTTLNPLWVVNSITALTIDMDMANTLATPFTGVGRASSSFAEGGAGAINYGTDGVNDFACGLAGECDMQFMANTTLNFRAERVPEPGTIALMGAGLGLAGLAGRRRKKQA